LLVPQQNEARMLGKMMNFSLEAPAENPKTWLMREVGFCLLGGYWGAASDLTWYMVCVSWRQWALDLHCEESSIGAAKAFHGYFPCLKYYWECAWLQIGWQLPWKRYDDLLWTTTHCTGTHYFLNLQHFSGCV